ncbi:hypothetical protein PR001_g7178 [Phytophthora rubi]|uniref:Uncharacterized protein n=1 Tax=Phytophthora rubi TaxID=129364 RepID=A0A6A3NA26_9STRA|nr:hypothetical protein PR001_g7178 [Phytophthora rubi]
MALAILYHEKVKRSQEKVGGASILIIACVAYSKLRSLQGQVAQEGGAFFVKMEKLRSLQGQVAQEDGAVPGEDGGGGASALNVACVACVEFSVKMEKLSSRQGQVARVGGAVLGQVGGRQRPERCVRRVRGVLREDGEAELADLNVACVACVEFSVKMEKLSSRPERCVRRVRGVLREDGEAELAAPS